MNRIEIRLASQPSLVGIEQKPTRMNLRWKQPELRMESTPPRVELESEGPSLSLDQTAVWEELGTGGVYHLIAENHTISQQKIMEAIAKISSEGDFLAAIENPGNTIAALADPYEEREFNVGVIPKSRPSAQIKYKVKIDWKLGRIKTEFTPGGHKFSIEQGYGRAYLRQRHYLKVWAVEASGNLLDWQVE